MTAAWKWLLLAPLLVITVLVVIGAILVAWFVWKTRHLTDDELRRLFGGDDLEL